MPTIIHLGYQISQDIINHNLPLDQFNQLYKHLQTLPKVVCQSSQKYKIYQIENLQHELNLDTQQILSVIPSYSQVKIQTLQNIQFQALIYHVNYQHLPETSFEPINRYYNVYEVLRTELHLDQVRFRFETKDSGSEIQIISDLTPEQLQPYINLLE